MGYLNRRIKRRANSINLSHPYSGKYVGMRTGSLLNLRAETGVDTKYRVSPVTLVYGELSFVGDMVRNNPTADLGGYRAGINPGGVTHQRTEDRSRNASCNFEPMQNVTSHSLNPEVATASDNHPDTE